MRTAIIGGGAAGFFLAINLKERRPEMDVTIFEGGQRVLAKVEISGGGRCNCTNSFADVRDLQTVYPRGHRLMKRLFKTFDYRDAYRWFEQRGVALVTQDDECVFPRSQDSHTIINLFLSEIRRLGIQVRTGCRIHSLDELSDYDYIAVTTGGQPRRQGLEWLQHDIVEPVPSLFTFSIDDSRLHELMGTVVEGATAMIPGTRLRAEGPLLITHWGMSGPCILRLSSYAARELHDADYRMPLLVNWVNRNDQEVQQVLTAILAEHPRKQLSTVRPFGLQQRLWNYLSEKALAGRAQAPWGSLNKKELNRLTTILTADSYQISGRAPFRDEFVTCGGISLQAVNPSTLESKTRPRLFFAGEVLDIDGITGGFNFQAAWTTAYVVSQNI
jgi:hypothetical protein